MTGMAESLMITIFAAVLKGMGMLQLKDLPSGSEKNSLSKGVLRPKPIPKKSPRGADTAGVLELSQYISKRNERSITGERSFTVSQMRRTIPAPLKSSMVLEP